MLTQPGMETTLKAAVAERLGESRFGLWFGEGVRLGVADDSDSLEVGVPNAFFRDWIQGHPCGQPHRRRPGGHRPVALSPGVPGRRRGVPPPLGHVVEAASARRQRPPQRALDSHPRAPGRSASSSGTDSGSGLIDAFATAPAAGRFRDRPRQPAGPRGEPGTRPGVARRVVQIRWSGWCGGGWGIIASSPCLGYSPIAKAMACREQDSNVPRSLERDARSRDRQQASPGSRFCLTYAMFSLRLLGGSPVT